MKKFNEMSNKSKAMIGVGTILGVAGIGTGVALATSTDVPADTKTVDDNMDKNENTKVNEAKEVVVAEKEDDKKKETNKDVDGKESEVTKKEKIEIKGDEQEEEAEKEENVKKETEEKEDGTKVTTEKTESKTPTAVVKVEKAPASSEKSKNVAVSKPAQKPTESAKKPAQPVKKQPVVTTKTTTATETIAFKTENKNDSSLEKGKTKVVQNGQNGTRTITYKETYKDGKLASKDQVSSKVTKNPVNKVVHVGTKAPAPAYLSASQAHSVLAGSGMKKNGNEYTLQSVHGQAVKVVVGSNHVSSIHHNTTSYISMGGMTKQELIDMLGPVEGQKEYEYGLKVRAEIEKAVRAAANAVYGAGTSKANALYNELISSWDNVYKTF